MRLPPPVLVGGILLLAWGLARVMPVPIGVAIPTLGGTVIAAALGLIVWALAVMMRAGNDPRPDRPDRAIVEHGPFRFSRNPIYLGFLLIAAGLALRWGDLWGWVAVVVAQLALDRLVIAREEAYLRARFGEAYASYARRVRRWL